MNRNRFFNRLFLLFTLVVLSTFGGFYSSKSIAQEPIEDIVYFTDGSVARGFIIHINRKIIRIGQTDGTIIERPVALLYRFYSKRHFSEIYNQALEEENLKFDKNLKD